MAKEKFDGVVEAVHYAPDGQVAWVRVYERRGPAFSDVVLLSRQELIERLRSGKKFVAGTRKPYLAGTFEIIHPLRLVQVNGNEYLTLMDDHPTHDRLDGLPVV